MTEHALRAGPLDVLLDGTDLRYVRLGPLELVRRVYAAVRDPDWSTIPATIEAIDVRDGGDTFAVTMQVRHTSPDVDVRVTGAIDGAADGTVTLTFDALALADTAYNRIGFCVLHPLAGFAGQPFVATTPDGTVAGTLPELIDPQRFEDGHYVPLFPSFSALELRPDGGPGLTISIEGDLLETEDQRNWTDASLKSYCTPLALGFPHRLAAGERRHQRVRIELAPSGPTIPRRAPTPGDTTEVTVVIADAPSATMPPIGVGLGYAADARADADAVRALGLAHVRLDVDLRRDGWARELGAALDAAHALGLESELALHVGDHAALAHVAAMLGERRPLRVMAFVGGAATATETETTTTALALALRSVLGGLGVPLVAGTDMAFCELNRTRPPVDEADAIVYPIVAQTHAFDNRSIVETLQAQSDTVRSARAFAPGHAVHVGPVTLRPRYNQHATRPQDADALADADPRLHEDFGAAWTVGSVAALAAAGAATLTYHEAAGPRGVAGHPVGRALAEMAALRGGAVHACAAHDPLAVAALAIDGVVGPRVIVANLGPMAREIHLHGPWAGAIPDAITLGPYEVKPLGA